MGERIISPGVFTNENDKSFTTQGIAEVGAVVVGPTEKGPAFIPTLIRNGFNEFSRRTKSINFDSMTDLYEKRTASCKDANL